MWRGRPLTALTVLNTEIVLIRDGIDRRAARCVRQDPTRVIDGYAASFAGRRPWRRSGTLGLAIGR